ncbi:MFS transporter [Streptomyces sp. NBC_01465]|uniref:MFS transporter n=1 Tax=Streptomyces sp. NBC_01465 TaxID=2903878 RepID=UPI002E36EF9D|nr:MFS transporter [Streptomyces sp. NBC_01465]
MTDRLRKLGFLLCLATILLAVLDLQIMSAATVPIVRDLDPAHGIDKIPWLVSAYALASAAMLPLYGKLCDVLGAKRIWLGAIATFLLGSVLCGAAQSMTQLIAARALQGIGGGGLMSVTMVVLAQLKGPEEKGGGKGGSMGGIFAGGGMAVGPWIGGLLADHANWRWIFYINLPVGIAVLVTSALVLKLPKPVHTAGRRSIDFLGAGLAAAFSSALLLAMEWGGKSYAWGSPLVVTLLVTAAAGLGLFLWRQTRAAQPVLPLSMFKVPELRGSFAIQGLLGAAMMGALMYVMIYLQTVRGIESSAAGLYLIPMALGMTAVGFLAGRLAWQARTFALGGSAVSALALVLLGTLTPTTSLWLIRADLLLLGIGFGQLIGQLILLVQEAAPREQLGVATTSIRFFQSLGNALGTALFGTLLARLYEANGPGSSTSHIAGLTGSEHAAAIGAFTDAMGIVFWCAAGLMALAASLALRLPAHKASLHRSVAVTTSPRTAPPAAARPGVPAPRGDRAPSSTASRHR